MHRVKADSFGQQGTDGFLSSSNYVREVPGNGISVPVSSPLERDSLAKMGGHSMGVFRTINWAALSDYNTCDHTRSIFNSKDRTHY